MRAADLIVISMFAVHPEIRAQAPVYEIQAGLGYTRMFDAGGISFSATSVQALYQNIYSSQTSNSAWNWHAGLSYGF